MKASGIRWIAGSDWWYGSVTFARGIELEEFAIRLGVVPSASHAEATDAEAGSLVFNGDVGVARLGVSGAWMFAVEYGVSRGTQVEALKEISHGGVEAVNLDPQVSHPPPMFSYAADGALRCSYGLGEEWQRWGTDPDLLNEEMRAAGIIMPTGDYLQVGGECHGQRVAMSLGILEKYFALSLPRDAVQNGRLRLIVTSGAPPLELLDR